MTYRVAKTYGHERGLSVAFRQHKALSHCRYIHGYALAFEFTFECKDDELDDRGWVLDFGDLGWLKSHLERDFDHRVLVAVDDPCKDDWRSLAVRGMANVRLVPATGCEAFSRQVAEFVQSELHRRYPDRVKLISVTVREHGSNGATYLCQQ